MGNLLLDASIFSRAIIGVDIGNLKKHVIQERRDVIVGNLTSMDGEILKYLNLNPIRARNRLPDGSLFRLTGERRYGLEVVEVPAGLTFEELINSLEKDGLYPVLFPLYPKGTIGGFIATNGSGFGSYKFGFVKHKVSVYELKDKDIATILAAKYPEIVELEQEIPYAWSGVIIDNSFKYYLPSSYSSILHIKGSSISTKSVIEEIFKITNQILKKDYLPICLRSSDYSLLQSAPIEKKIGYVINYNSPSKYYVICGSVRSDEIEGLFNFLKRNPSVLPFPNLREYSEIHKIILDKYRKGKIIVPKHLDKFKNEFLEASKCINCGLCLEHCIAFNTTNNILYSPVGKFNRLITGETQFEHCFGCKEEEDYCPQGINISMLASEFLPKISTVKEKVNIQIDRVSIRIKELESKLDAKYRNKPLFVLLIGCAYKYDPLGVEGFLDFLLENGDKLSENYSPRVKIIDEMCCGFDKYLSGNVEEAKADVAKILETKQRLGAMGIYFLCPEGLYVYNSLSGDKGILGYEVVKPYIKAKVHSGCWARKLGIEGDDKECAGLFLTSYKNSSVPLKVKKKDEILTICPFSTWKFSTKSVYSAFLKEIQLKEVEVIQVSDQLIIDVVRRSLLQAAYDSVDEVADKMINWIMGGKTYFTLIILPIIRKKFVIIIKDELRKNEDIMNYFKSIVNNKILFYDKLSKIAYSLSSAEYKEVASEIMKKVLNSPKLAYEAKNLVKSQDFEDAIDYVLKNIVKEKVLEDVLRDLLIV